jgi:Predicted xylanase/chitin deacetylase
LFDDLQIPVTAAVNAFACYDVPGLIELIKTRRWCVVAHGTRNDVRHDLLSEAEERAEIAETTEVLRTAFGVRPRGWLTPGFAVSSHTHELLAEAGYEYVLDWTNDDIPYWIGAGSRELFALPYSLESNDISLCIASGLAPPAFASAIEDHVLELWKEGAVVPKTTAVGLHTFVAGQPARLRHLRAALAALRDREGIWWSTADELADATRDQCR